eukprot:768364-Hanusia_phi.AAC.1
MSTAVLPHFVSPRRRGPYLSLDKKPTLAITLDTLDGLFHLRQTDAAVSLVRSFAAGSVWPVLLTFLFGTRAYLSRRSRTPADGWEYAGGLIRGYLSAAQPPLKPPRPPCQALFHEQLMPGLGWDGQEGVWAWGERSCWRRLSCTRGDRRFHQVSVGSRLKEALHV